MQFHFMCVSRFSSVDAGNIVRLLAPDIVLLFSSLFILRLCRKLLRRVPQVNLNENGIPAPAPEVMKDTHHHFLKNNLTLG